jgi:hypothetical protein
MVKKKYRALRAIAFVFQVLAWVSLVLAILGAVGAVGAGLLGIMTIPALENIFGAYLKIEGAVVGIIGAVGVLLVGIVNFVLLLAGSDYIYVQLDIEQNTRLSSEYLRQVVQGQQPAPYATSYMPTGPSTPLPPESYPTQSTITVQTPTTPK